MQPASSRAPGLVLIAVCLALAAGLYFRHRAAVQEQQRSLATLTQLSNACHTACLKLNEQKTVNLSLERELSTALEEANGYSNKLNQVSADLSKTKLAQVNQTTSASQTGARITELQEERDGLSAKLTDLTGALAKLDSHLAETQRKLQASEGDRNALLKELKRLQAERADLMRQFTDLNLVRERLRQLKAEQSLSRRLEWIRRGTYGSYKGAELLRNKVASASPALGNYDLNVELRRHPTPDAQPIGGSGDSGKRE